MTKHGDRVYTPKWCVDDMTRHFAPSGRVLEPARGDGAFTDVLPDADWCEIDEGRDFFLWETPVDWIISNPPYSKTRPFFNHAMRVAANVVFLVPLRNVFSGFGFVAELYRSGGIKEMRLYGTGGRLGFPMGNAVGAIHWQRAYTGPIEMSFFDAGTLLEGRASPEATQTKKEI